MLKTATVTELRTELADYLRSLKDGPLLVLSHSRPAAVLVEPEMFDLLLEKAEWLEDLLDGHRAVQEYHKDPRIAVEAEEIFERLGPG